VEDVAALPDGSNGDGVTCTQASTLSLTRSRVVRGARAGIAAWGSSVTLSSSSIGCDAFDLDGEPDIDGTGSSEFSLDQTTCGCETAESCQVLHTQLVAPTGL
jgi:hypothetical protein